MPDARTYVAKAIADSEDCGGAGILTPEEVEALEWVVSEGMVALADAHNRPPQHLTTLLGLLHDLGHNRMHIHGLGPTRVDSYYLKCADLAIGKYEEWLDAKAHPHS